MSDLNIQSGTATFGQVGIGHGVSTERVRDARIGEGGPPSSIQVKKRESTLGTRRRGGRLSPGEQENIEQFLASKR
jgi:hypothetical protein